MATTSARHLITIDIVSDTICPWCFVGKRRLERALKGFSPEKYKFDIKWHPFYLDPTLPDEGVDKAARLKEKFGDRAIQIQEHLARIGLKEGIRFNPAGKMSNTLNSHRLIDYAGQHGKQDEVVEALFKAYFEDGKNLGDLALLIEIGKKAGLPMVEEFIKSDKGKKEVLDEITHNMWRRNISGVPHFVFTSEKGLLYEIEGAQDSDVFKEVIEELSE